MVIDKNAPMKKYTVYFEIFGKKLKVTVEADSKHEAMEYVKSQLTFHKVEDITPWGDDEVAKFFNIFGKK